MKKKLISALLVSCMVFSSAAGALAESETDPESTVSETSVLPEQIDMSKWMYDEGDDVFYQLEITYCAAPVDLTYETMGIFVPGAYFEAQENGDGTYTCRLREDGSVGDFTALTAPIVFPVETPGYSAMSAPSSYEDASRVSMTTYTGEGMIFLYAGCRGRDAGAPAGVTDLKAALRFYRYNEELLPGDTQRIFSEGMSGGGAQSALMGATGDSELYTPYLEAIGAVMEESDAVAGSMCWCPITNLDVADAAYEWNLGVSRSDLDEETKQLSDGLAEAFAAYINELELTDQNGELLTLEESEEGIFQSGSYYDYLVSVVEESLNNFLADTEFPYTASSSMGGGMGGFGGRDGGRGKEMGGPGAGKFNFNGAGPEGELPEGMSEDDEVSFDGAGPEGELPEGMSEDDGQTDYAAVDGISRTENAEDAAASSGTYETPEEYIAALNADGTWVTYDSETNTATITSLEDFVKSQKNASKSVGAFDDLNKSQGENILFGYGDGEGAHFDVIEAELLQGTSYEESFVEDLERTDALGSSVRERMNMYNPMYYLSGYYGGFGSSQVASYWRIRTGITQGDTALCTEVDLSLALEAYGGLDVDFETVWGQGHTKAERTGSSDENCVEWIKECVADMEA